MKGITSHNIKLDQEMSYEDAKNIKDFTESFKKNDRLKINFGTIISNNNGEFEKNYIVTFTKSHNNNLEKIINKFEKLKNNIFVNKSLFHKPDLVENIFNYSSISAKKLNLHANKMMVEISSADLKKEVAAHKELITENNLISTEQRIPKEEINKMLEDYEKYKTENNKEEIQPNNTNTKNTDADELWKIIKNDIGL